MAISKRLAKAKRGGLLVGRLSMNRKGFGFVEAPEGDIYIPARETSGAMHGDTVGVRVNAGRSRQGRSGTVLKIFERANETLVGRFENHSRVGVVVPVDSRIQHDVFVHRKDAGQASPGDIVVVRLTAFPSRRQSATGVIEEVLGPQGTPGLEIEVIIRQHGLRTEFPLEVTSHAASRTLDVEQALGEPDRRDLRDKLTFTIDPSDARDFDDAITAERVDGVLRLGVHIADVGHYVRWDDPVDLEARKRGTSVYLVDRVLPMLPEHLSNHLCSLNPGECRLAFSVMMDLDGNGALVGYELFPSVIRSDMRFDYDQVQRFLDGKESLADRDLEQAVREVARAAELLRKRRLARGGLDFETVEAKVRLADDGAPLEVVLRERTQATNMIEEAMIRANEAVAEHMLQAGAPMVYRIHEKPDPEALSPVAAVLKEFDYPVSEIRGATPATFARIIAYAHNRPEKRLINSLLLRAMQRARYTAYIDTHFGLASDAYSHFTSPIRRYPDLVVHRLLRAVLREGAQAPELMTAAEDLEWIADHSSTMEREAEAAEDETVRLKIAQLLAGHVGEVFDGIITGVHSYGLFVQLENTAEGLVHVRSMIDDYYELDATGFSLIGRERRRSYRLGERVSVRITNVSTVDARIDFEIRS